MGSKMVFSVVPTDHPKSECSHCVIVYFCDECVAISFGPFEMNMEKLVLWPMAYLGLFLLPVKSMTDEVVIL